MTYLSHVQAELARLSTQLDCTHTFARNGNRRVCLTCHYHFVVCSSCSAALNRDGSCDWCVA